MYDINNLPSFITLGRQGESNVTTLEFDCSPWLTAYPGISIGITLARPGDALSDAIVCGGTEVVGNVLTWTVRAPETERAGTGTVVITGVLAGKRVKSTMVYVVVAASHTAGDTPEWYADYKDAMIDIKAQTVTARAGAQLAETGSKEARDETLGYLDETRAARDAAAQYEQGALEQADRAEFAAEEAETAMLDTLSLRTEYQGYLSDTQDAKQGAEAARDAAAQHEAGAQVQAERAELAAEEAETALTKLTTLDVSATGLPAGSAPTVTRTETDTGISLALGIPEGQRGEKGDPGEVSMAQMTAAIGAAIAPVNAQLAENAELADNSALWRTATGNPATCYPVPKTHLYPRIAFTATQDGSGDPSPENIRPIVPALVNGGKVTLSHSDGVITPTQYEWTAPQDIYGLPGAETYVDWEKGELVVGDARKVLTGTENFIEYGAGSEIFYVGSTSLPGVNYNVAPRCSHYIGRVGASSLPNGCLGVSGGINGFAIKDANIHTLTAMKAYLAAQYAAGTPVVIQYQLATPLRIPLTDLPAINALPQLDRYTPRQNVLTVDKGALTVGYSKSPIRESDELAAAIAALA